MRIHHLNCVSACPLGGFLMDGASNSLRGRLTSHCLLIETANALVLVDTGYGLRDVADPRSRLAKTFLTLVKPELRAELTAYRQVQALGYDPRDVRHVVISHLDFDHAGGLDDFPEATVHMLADEERAARQRRTILDRMRYRPEQWGTRANWRCHATSAGEDWHGFSCVRDLPGLSAELLMVPLIGHTLGHAGVAIRRERDWLFYAADAYFYHAEMDLEEPRCTPGLALYQTMMEKNRACRLFNQGRLRALKRELAGELTIFCAHDVREFERLSGRSSHEPAVLSQRTGAAAEHERPPVRDASGSGERWDAVDEASWESFPASDPPAKWAGRDLIPPTLNGEA
jgi:glyoxylase-like metal-dependent hydrolase (beta-lactamase superfamily II)